MFVVDNTKRIGTKEIFFDDLKNLTGSIAKKILLELKTPNYPKNIAKKLKLNEQNVYYYIKKFKKANIVSLERKENINGTVANYYVLNSESYFFKLSEFKKSNKENIEDKNLLKNFFTGSNFNGKIILGSQDPHGPLLARSKDAMLSLDLVLFLGSFISSVPKHQIFFQDLNIKNEDLKDNLIIIGGPIVNKVSFDLNSYLNIMFKDKSLYSKSSGKTYIEESVGCINKIKNPFNKQKDIIVISGIKQMGTKAAIIAFTKYFDDLCVTNKFSDNSFSRVVKGIDTNFDGVIDDIEFLE